MTKAEAIRETGYKEEDLVYIALTCAVNKFQTHWFECESDGDVEGAEHYKKLTTAYNAMRDEMDAKK